MFVYLLVACDGLDESQEKKLKKQLPELRAALQTYAHANTANQVMLIDQCNSEDCADWQLGISQPIGKNAHLKFPVDLFNNLAKQHGIDCEIGTLENNERDPVSYFGKSEGRGDVYLLAEYLGL
ncbi:hypothetical protein QWY82_02435 [Simiduia curdlanivorans]|uniref:Lipoprotein n=1 Tax=Simiduia curdlanivorans TaxID=1492769 RepID=A0ABV8V2G1_9GAMM|nr:hypothetical protein [Simiduia curdlanivorans]MDN3637656.1 hypothetical protein [Simiduia curdlanivorans]